jgi:CRISPR system Cascade subunit CasA
VTFNLLHEPWIPVKTASGDLAEVSILECFRRSHELVVVVGETPSQAASTLRLLIAILYRALPVTRPKPGVGWQAWWDADSLPMVDIEAYLERYADRFDLFHETQPFMQVAALRANKTSGLAKLIADVPDGEQFFTTRAGASVERISPAEAARWLVHCHAFDPSGIKTGAVGDPRVKGGKGYPIGVGWAGWCGLIFARGNTLRETLLLNLDLHLNVRADSASWERPPHDVTTDDEHPEPLGPADIMTWQSRRVALLRDDRGMVVDAVIANGDPIHPRNRQALEPHCGWRFSTPQTKAHGIDVYMPRSHDPARALWRGLPSLLPQPESVSAKDRAPALPPNVLEWLASLVQNGHLDPAYPLQLAAVGVTYGSQSSTITAMVDDAIRLRVAVVANPPLREAVSDSVAAAETGVTAVRHLAANLAAASGIHDTEGQVNKATEAGYSVLDTAYPQWMAGLTPEVNVVDKATDWQLFVADALNQLAGQLISDAGEVAWLGRVARRHDGTEHRIDSSLASAYFRSAIRKALPLAHPQRPTQSEEER